MGCTLSGAKLELYRKAATASDTGTLVGAYTTDADGKIKVTTKVGDHYWVKIQSPSGYQLDKTKREFTLSGSGTNPATTSSFHDVARHWVERKIAVAATNGWIKLQRWLVQT